MFMRVMFMYMKNYGINGFLSCGSSKFHPAETGLDFGGVVEFVTVKAPKSHKNQQGSARIR